MNLVDSALNRKGFASRLGFAAAWRPAWSLPFPRNGGQQDGGLEQSISALAAHWNHLRVCQKYPCPRLNPQTNQLGSLRLELRGALATFPDDQLQAGGAPRCHRAVNCNWEEMRRNGEQEKTPSVDHTQGWPTGRRRRCGEACPPWGQPSPPAWVWPGLGADAAERAGQPADRSGGPRGHRAAARP